MRESFIYGLYDPRDPSKIRYVGQTRVGESRLRGYLGLESLVTNSKMIEWITSIWDAGLVPGWKKIHVCSPEELDDLEISCIAELRAAGHDLLNVQAGGSGRKLTEASKKSPTDPRSPGEKISEKAKLRWQDPEFRERARQRGLEQAKREREEREARKLQERKERARSPEQRKAREELIRRGYGWAIGED